MEFFEDYRTRTTTTTKKRTYHESCCPCCKRASQIELNYLKETLKVFTHERTIKKQELEIKKLKKLSIKR